MSTMEAGNLQAREMGYGAMVLENPYGVSRLVAEDEAVDLIREVVDMGVTHIDTADAYGNGRNETIVGKALKSVSSEDIVVATKVGLNLSSPDARSHDTNWGFAFPVNGTPKYIKGAVDQSLLRLDLAVPPVVYLHYGDPEVPIEDSVGALADLKRNGNISGIGLSNVTDVAALERAHREHSIDYVQNEYSLQNRPLGGKVMAAAHRLGATFVAWAPLGAGMLTTDITRLSENDPRRLRFETGQASQAAIDSLDILRQTASDMDVTPAQLALAWIYHQGQEDGKIIPIPGSSDPSRMRENLGARSIDIDDARLQRLSALAFDYKPMLG